MEFDPLEPPGCLSKLSRGGAQAELVHLTVDQELEVFLYRTCHGDVQICVLYVNGHSPFALFDGQPDWCLGFHLELWNDQMVIQAGEIYDRTQNPCLLWHQERDGWRNPWFLGGKVAQIAFGQELVHCCLKVLGRILGAEGDGCASQWRLWFPVHHDCLQVCMTHSIHLVGCATVGQRLPCEPPPAALWWKHHVSYRAIVSGPSGQFLGCVQTSGRHGGCWHGKGSQRSIQMGRFNEIIQVTNPLVVLILVEHFSWSQELEAVREWRMFAQRHPRKLISFLDA